MNVIECRQGSPEWFAARCGIPTASQFSKILTPGGKPSASAPEYAHRLVAERILGHPIEVDGNGWMERGSKMEAEALAFFELQRGIDARKVGFCTTDDGIAGCSPDFLVGEDEGGEIKVPSAAVHVGYLLDVEPKKYWAQIQGALWVTGRKRWWFLSYCPDFPQALTCYERDESYIDALDSAVRAFSEYVETAHRKLEDKITRRAA